MSHHFAVAMPQGNFSINQCCSGLKWHDVAGSNIPMNENQYTIHSKDNTSTQAACGNHQWEKMTIYRLCKIHTELNECKQGTWNDVHIRNSPTRFVHIKFSVVFICMYMIMKAIECSRQHAKRCMFFLQKRAHGQMELLHMPQLKLIPDPGDHRQIRPNKKKSNTILTVTTPR